jgi:hypothetical protein
MPIQSPAIAVCRTKRIDGLAVTGTVLAVTAFPAGILDITKTPPSLAILIGCTF